MCNTHEPPTAHNTQRRVLLQEEVVLKKTDTKSDSSKGLSWGKGVKVYQGPQSDVDPADVSFAHSITRGQLCAFLPGYLEFFQETKLTASSILHFMPGMRIAIATNPFNFHVYNR